MDVRVLVVLDPERREGDAVDAYVAEAVQERLHAQLQALPDRVLRDDDGAGVTTAAVDDALQRVRARTKSAPPLLRP